MLPRIVQMFFKAVATRSQLCKFAYIGQLYLFPISTLLIPSYFGPTPYTNGGVIWTPYPISTWLYKPQILQVLQIPFKVSENTRFAKNLLYGYHGNCLITWCFSLIIVKTSMKNRYFSNAPRNHKLEGVKIKLSVMIVLFSKSNFKVSGSARSLGGTSRKTGLNAEKLSFSQGLRREFSRLSLTHKNTLFYTFFYQIHSPQSSKSTKKLKNCIFGQISNRSLIFTLSLFWG